MPTESCGISQTASSKDQTKAFRFSLLSIITLRSVTSFNTTLTDYWGRALSFQLINATDGGPAYTMSSIADAANFANGLIPMPIMLSDSRRPGQVLIASNTTIVEFNPWEMGSWDPSLFGFSPMKYVGSNFSNGVLPDGEPCIAGFDNIGFTYGTSSTLFNQIVLQFNRTVNLPSFIENGIQDILNDFGQSNNDISDWSPNPFKGYNPGSNVFAGTDQLFLVDGGEDNENIPLHPLIQPLRKVDVIVAIDSSADTTYNWPNGSSLVATYERSLNSTLGLNTHPVFFGCNSSNSTNALGNVPSPLIVYLPNAPYSFYSNVSTFNLSMSSLNLQEL
ncbi:hypothetical protein MRB53_042173 [Persea americana]|nr:hypothetical protein MRB53_042173 [Persea americana]